jgi:hypothetical protein
MKNLKKIHLVTVAVIAGLLFSCSSSERVATDNFIQKRKYNKGFYFSNSRVKTGSQFTVVNTQESSDVNELTYQISDEIIVEEEALTAEIETGTITADAKNAKASKNFAAKAQTEDLIPAFLINQLIPLKVARREVSFPVKKNNAKFSDALNIISFIFGLSCIAFLAFGFYSTTVSFLLSFLAVFSGVIGIKTGGKYYRLAITGITLGAMYFFLTILLGIFMVIFEAL